MKQLPICLQRLSAPRLLRPFVTLVLLVFATAAFPHRASAQVSDAAFLASLQSYTVTLKAFQNATCSGGYCRMAFPPVPAGKRLLVTYVSLNTYNGTSNYLDAVLSNGITDYSDPNYRNINLPGGLVAKNTTSGFGYTLTWGGNVNFFIEAGSAPTFVYNGSVLTNEYAGIGTISGFLIPQ